MAAPPVLENEGRSAAGNSPKPFEKLFELEGLPQNTLDPFLPTHQRFDKAPTRRHYHQYNLYSLIIIL